MKLKDHGYYHTRMGEVIEIQRMSSKQIADNYWHDTHICLKNIVWTYHPQMVGMTWGETGRYQPTGGESVLDLVKELTEEEVVMYLLGEQK